MKILSLSLYCLILVSCTHNSNIKQDSEKITDIGDKTKSSVMNSKSKKTCSKGSIININGNVHTHPVGTTKNYSTIRHRHQQGGCAHLHNYSR